LIERLTTCEGGRGQETPGEDMFRTSQYTKYLLQGLEGGVNPPIKKVIASCKHLAAYDLEQNRDPSSVIYNRFGYNAVVVSVAPEDWGERRCEANVDT
jgi:beta-glucosidase-like glycosyl hydrolase